MKRLVVAIATILVGFCTLHSAKAMWADVPLEKLVAENPVIVVGEIVEIKAAELPKQKFDTAFIKVSAVLKNTLKNKNIKVGDKIPLGMPAAGKLMVSTAIRYKKGQEGVWILEYKDKKFWASYPKDYQPLKQKDKIAGIIQTQKKK